MGNRCRRIQFDVTLTAAKKNETDGIGPRQIRSKRIGDSRNPAYFYTHQLRLDCKARECIKPCEIKMQVRRGSVAHHTHVNKEFMQYHHILK